MRSLPRKAWSSLLLSVGLSLAVSPLVSVAGAQSSSWSDPDDVEAFDDEALFVIGNTLFTVYHELGHALIDLLNLPVIGREEDAVDGFAAVTMIPKTPDPVRDALIVAVADGWRAQSTIGTAGSERLYWGQHALNEQRHFAIVCLMVGSDQEGFYDFALEAGLPEERIRTCSQDFSRMKSGWHRLLGPHRQDVETTGLTAMPPIALVFDQPPSELEEPFYLIREQELLENAILRFGDDLALPAPITVRFRTCDEANAFWSEDQLEVTICYELVDEFRAMLLGSVVR